MVKQELIVIIKAASAEAAADIPEHVAGAVLDAAADVTYRPCSVRIKGHGATVNFKCSAENGTGGL